MIPATILIATIVPRQYDARKLKAVRHEDIARAGAMLGAPSQDRPCMMPLKNIALIGFLFSEGKAGKTRVK